MCSRHFILGYGSLINSESRAKTGKTGQVWPVKLRGFERHWSVISPDFAMSSVAVVKATNSACNGVLVEVAADQLPLFDKREAGYQRAQIPVEALFSYRDQVLPQGTYWIYHTDNIVTPDQQCPIALSYVDVILSGCLEHGEEFVQDFLQLTKGWLSPSVNDRQAPRYPRVQPDVLTTELNKLLETVSILSFFELSISYEP